MEAGSGEGQVANAGESWWNQEQKAWGPGPCPQPGLHPGRWGQAYWRSMHQAGQVSVWEGLEVLFGMGVGSHSWGGSSVSICEGGTPARYPRRGAEAEGTAAHRGWSHPGALGLRAMCLATGSLGVSSSNWHSGHLSPTLGPPTGMRMSSEPEHQKDQGSAAHLVPACQ